MDPGTVVASRFVVESLAGEGGMSVVYRASDRLTGDVVALKVLRDEMQDPGTWPEAVARMMREARAAAALDHPNVVSVHELGESAGDFVVIDRLGDDRHACCFCPP